MNATATAQDNVTEEVIGSPLAMWELDVQNIELEKGEGGLGFSILDYQVGLLTREYRRCDRCYYGGGREIFCLSEFQVYSGIIHFNSCTVHIILVIPKTVDVFSLNSTDPARATGPTGPRQDSDRHSLSGSRRRGRTGWQTVAGRPTHVR